MKVVKYSSKVSAKYLIFLATETTCNVVGTKSTHLFYTEESESYDEYGYDNSSGSSVQTESSNAVGETVEDAVARIKDQILVLDKIGFDETEDSDETDDM